MSEEVGLAIKRQGHKHPKAESRPGSARSRPARVGLARALSKLGYCSRRCGQQLILQGRVRVDGKVRRDPETPVRWERQLIEVDGKLVTSSQRLYLMLHKPRGLVTTVADEHQRATVYDCLAGARLPFLSPVGRLDKESEGLLLFTNDHGWAAALLDPEAEVWRTYRVEVEGQVRPEQLRYMRSGVATSGGAVLAARRVRLLARTEHGALLELVLDEGKNRHIRRLMTALGLKVRRLIRVAFGPLRLGDLQPGQWRLLERSEVQKLIARVPPRVRERYLL